MGQRRVMIDPDGTSNSYTGVIIQFPTRVIYEQQCAGTDCDQRSVEGYYVPLGGCRFDPEHGRIDFESLRAPFHDGDACYFGGKLIPASPNTCKLPPERLTQLRAAVESITYWVSEANTEAQPRTRLRIDDSRLAELVEAWVPILTPDGPGILTWPNCD